MACHVESHGVKVMPGVTAAELVIWTAGLPSNKPLKQNAFNAMCLFSCYRVLPVAIVRLAPQTLFWKA